MHGTALRWKQIKVTSIAILAVSTTCALDPVHTFALSRRLSLSVASLATTKASTTFLPIVASLSEFFVLGVRMVEVTLNRR